MFRKPKILRQRNHSAAFLVLGSLAVAGLLLFALTRFEPDADPVGGISTPEVAGAPEPTTERAPEAETAAPAETTDAASEGLEQTTREDEPPEEAAATQESTGTEEAADAQVVPPGSPELYLTVPKMGLYGDYVASGSDEATLMNGAGRVPYSGLPWQPGSNTYIASHVLGYEGTGSYLHFAALPSMTYGDEILLTDANGNEYRYSVYEVLQVSIYDTWVIEPVGESVVSLQTCINPPAYDVRLVVRGRLVETVPA
ncbi:Sortase family [Rubrobacter radiotolerans]|uniref:Class E sortase n=1 Tax=Rubrobacter radiotolerans TaxID=42256 RepID=A0A023WZW6_RUBRA|nr:class E sortase [Rubrobacter radiotolerans]AHY45593.1 Sortase family [Rubrobacter radiotolerans]MDX5893007.1 class E sortase [Rubrobacter radiotolerans]SMC02893.1 sortase A [Rubrobacter radiotolerans DSM 5868]